jgi:outer membrane protein assembly factor BamB
MAALTDKYSVGSETVSPWRQTAVRTAVVGGVFSLIVLALLSMNYYRRVVVDAGLTEELDRLKLEFAGQPDNEQLGSRIRRLDLQVRQDRIRRLDFSRRGSYLLVGGIAVFLIGTKSARTFKKKLPSPQPQGDERELQIRKAMQARRAVTVGSVALGVFVLLVTLTPTIDFSGSDAAGTSYPSADEISKNWPRFRGPGGAGLSAYTGVPTHWNGTTGEGILWKSKVPLPGYNSPVVWDNRVFLTGADANESVVYCFDALSGEPMWQGQIGRIPVRTGEPLEEAPDSGFAASTAVTDGRRVCAIFANGDVACFDIEGKKLWVANLGVPESTYGYATSLAMYRNLLVVQYDQATAEDEKSKLIALSVFSGQPLWQTNRPVSNSWTSPIVIRVGDQDQIITCGDPWVIAYAPATGAELWRAECLGTDVAPSPIYAGGLVIAIEPYAKLVAIKPDGRGDVTKTHVAWSIDKDAPDICTPVSNGKLLFVLTSSGTLTCCNVADGKKLWESDVDGSFQASPSLVGDRLYLLSDKGVMFIAKVGSEYTELARCELGEPCYASPAFADGRIYIRGKDNLYCIGKVNP